MADVSDTSAFVRKDAIFRNRIDPAGEFPPAAGRFHLYVSYACPWASRCIAALGLKGLTNVISMSSVHPTWQETRPDPMFHRGGPAPCLAQGGALQLHLASTPQD